MQCRKLKDIFSPFRHAFSQSGILFVKLASEFLLGCKLCRQNNFDEGLRKLQKVAKMAKKEGFGDLAKEVKISNSEFLIEKRTFSGR